ncbi:hypothetical protein [Salmonella enterica]
MNTLRYRLQRSMEKPA